MAKVAVKGNYFAQGLLGLAAKLALAFAATQEIACATEHSALGTNSGTQWNNINFDPITLPDGRKITDIEPDVDESGDDVALKIRAPDLGTTGVRKGLIVEYHPNKNRVIYRSDAPSYYEEQLIPQVMAQADNENSRLNQLIGAETDAVNAFKKSLGKMDGAEAIAKLLVEKDFGNTALKTAADGKPLSANAWALERLVVTNNAFQALLRNPYNEESKATYDAAKKAIADAQQALAGRGIDSKLAQQVLDAQIAIENHRRNMFSHGTLLTIEAAVKYEQDRSFRGVLAAHYLVRASGAHLFQAYPPYDLSKYAEAYSAAQIIQAPDGIPAIFKGASCGGANSSYPNPEVEGHCTPREKKDGFILGTNNLDGKEIPFSNGAGKQLYQGTTLDRREVVGPRSRLPRTVDSNGVAEGPEILFDYHDGLYELGSPYDTLRFAKDGPLRAPYAFYQVYWLGNTPYVYGPNGEQVETPEDTFWWHVKEGRKGALEDHQRNFGPLPSPGPLPTPGGKGPGPETGPDTGTGPRTGDGVGQNGGVKTQNTAIIVKCPERSDKPCIEVNNNGGNTGQAPGPGATGGTPGTTGTPGSAPSTSVTEPGTYVLDGDELKPVERAGSGNDGKINYGIEVNLNDNRTGQGGKGGDGGGQASNGGGEQTTVICEEGQVPVSTGTDGKVRCMLEDTQKLLERILAERQTLRLNCPPDRRAGLMKDMFQDTLELARRVNKGDSPELARRVNKGDSPEWAKETLQEIMGAYTNNPYLGRHLSKEEVQEWKDLAKDLGIKVKPAPKLRTNGHKEEGSDPQGTRGLHDQRRNMRLYTQRPMYG